MGRRIVARFGVAFVVPLLVAVPATADAHTLTYGKAKRAAQAKGNDLAGKRVRVNSLLRTAPHRFYAQVKWTDIDPDGCVGCGYNPSTGTTYDTATTEYCHAELSVRFRSVTSRRTRVSTISRSCF